MSSKIKQRHAGRRLHEYDNVDVPLFMKALRPASAGALTAAVIAACPSHLLPSLPFSEAIGSSGILQVLPTKVLLAVAGFILGYCSSKTAGWTRMKLIKRLLTYSGWTTAPKSSKTKAWAMLLKLLKGPGPFSTYEFQGCLPQQPLPSLDDTLDKWLAVNAELMGEEDFLATKQAIENFRRNEGPRLHQHLMERSAREINWLYDYWMTAAYLANRDSLSINSNYYSLLSIRKSRTQSMLARAATTINLVAEYAELLESEKPPPVQMQELVPICMFGSKFIFNTFRKPGESLDTIERFPGKRHITVITKGQYFVFDLVAPGINGKKSILSASEVKVQLERIMELSKESSESCDLAALTAQNRTTWAKHRAILEKNNPESLHTLESSLCIICLDEYHSQDVDEMCKRIFTGTGTDRWFDKGFSLIFFGNGMMGNNVEHTAIDATVFGGLSEYHTLHEQYDDNGDVIKTAAPNRQLPSPKRLGWNVQDLEEPISQALKEYRNVVSDLELVTLNAPYGKGFMKKCRISPDGFIQMSMQLAYYRMHGSFPKTYEPATGRLFLLGRTETIHVISSSCKAWVMAMDDPNATIETKRGLLKKAVDHQTAYKLQATAGLGCDRHLLGLYIASRELGMDVPQIFIDKSWRDPFLLSTSQTPNELYNVGAGLDFPDTIGGFGPYCQDGYGVSYIIHGDEIVNFSIAAYHSCQSTSAKRFSDNLAKVMEDMKAMFEKK